jgi:pSer/pThr/pTyr-binding forkhead associated (FHA) protein
MDHEPVPIEATGLSAQLPPLRLRTTDPLPADFAPLRLILDPGGASVVADKPSVLIGRHTDADVRLPLPDVSRRHCRLLFADGRWQVIDLNSLNGVHVNGEQVLQAGLDHGDRLKIGGFIFVVDLSGEEEPPGQVRSIFKTLAVSPQRRAC